MQRRATIKYIVVALLVVGLALLVWNGRTIHAQAQLGASLARYGELERAKEAFTAALNRQGRSAVRDYGSPLRDRAALLALLAESGLLPERMPQLAEEVAAGRLRADQVDEDHLGRPQASAAVGPRLEMLAELATGGLQALVQPLRWST